MQAVKVPSGVLPGEKMNEADFINEMNRGKKFGIILAIVLVLAVAGGLVAYFVFGGDDGDSAGHGSGSAAAAEKKAEH